MDRVVTTGAIKHAKLRSNRHHQQTNTQIFICLMPFLSPTNSVKALTEKYHIPRPCSPQAHLGGLPTLSTTTKVSCYPEEGCHASHQPSYASTSKFNTNHQGELRKVRKMKQSKQSTTLTSVLSGRVLGGTATFVLP